MKRAQRARQEYLLRIRQRRKFRKKCARESARRQRRQLQTRQTQLNNIGDNRLNAARKEAECAIAKIATPLLVAVVEVQAQHSFEGLQLDETTIADIQQWREQLSDTDDLILFSDGSLKDMATEQIKMTFGVVVQRDYDYERVISGAVDGYASSAKAELPGLLAAILCSPRGKDVTVKLDNSGVVKGFRRL
ncbi:hypothetical protein BGW38_004355, partial [Lunasporangiospora selenospora]